MRRVSHCATPAVVAAFGVALLTGCGSSTKTVSVAETPAANGTTATATEPATSTPSTSTGTATAPPQTTTGGGSPAPTSTRKAPEPAFTHQEAKGEGLSAAGAVVRANGYTPTNTSDYHPDQALRVLVGVRTGSADGYAQRAFFFVNGHYIGTDSKEPSAGVRVVSQSDTEVTIAYPLYRKNDPLCCPSGGQARVRFQLNNGKLVPLDPIPPAESNSGLSRQ